MCVICVIGLLLDHFRNVFVQVDSCLNTEVVVVDSRCCSWAFILKGRSGYQAFNSAFKSDATHDFRV